MKTNLNSWLATLALVAFALCTHANAQQTSEAAPEIDPAYAQSIRYENHQAFTGQSFFKDNNIWVYTAAFAQTFGMPKEGVDALVGAEAVAFRAEDSGYKTCGMGGKAANCMKDIRYAMDVYIDERKHPQPWADPTQMADWLGEYNSSQWLRIGTAPLNQRSGRISPSPMGAAQSRVFQGVRTLRPFANPQNNMEVFWIHNASTDRNLLSDDAFNFLAIAGYKRNAIAGLTLITFYAHDTLGPTDRELRLRLVEREWIMSPTLRQYQEIVIPARFIAARARAVKQQQELDEQFYRSLFRPPLGTNPNANPLPSSSK